MTAYLIAGGGIVLLVWFAVLIGISMDTEAQRREGKRVAAQRRLRWEEQRIDPDDLCADCPFCDVA